MFIRAFVFTFIIAVSLWTGGLFHADAEENPSREYAIKAAFLYNFAKFVEWPSNAFTDNKAPVRLCVLGKDSFGIALDSLEGKTIHGRKLTIERLNCTEDLTICHILFISETEKKQLANIFDHVKYSSVLTVGDTENFAGLGGIINFTMVKKKIRFQINLAAADRAELKISSKLLKLADIIKE